jgi:NADH-quinone oxidoreductase subunit E
MDRQQISEIVEKYKNPSGKVLAILEDIQEKERYISKETLKTVSEITNIPLSKLFSVVSFYSFFNLNPVGRHIISVCTGTACHVKGAMEIVKNFQYLLNISKTDEVSEDGKFMLTTTDNCFSLNTARCFGCCSMAPVVRIDEKIYGYVKLSELPKILKEYR